MDPRAEIREFLATRRAKITPGQAGMRLYGGRRRVAGLRRGGGAMLARGSVHYHTPRGEGERAGGSPRGPAAGAPAPPPGPARARPPLSPRPRPARPRPPPAPPRATPRVAASVQHILDAAATAAAFARNGRLDLLAANALAHALYTPLCAGPARPANLARFCFLD